MPMHNDKSKANKKRTGLEERTRSKFEVTVKADPKVKGLGYLTTPVHIPEPADRRLPSREADYVHQARPDGRPETKQEARIRQFHKDGFTLERICINTGVTPQSVARLLNIPTNTDEFKETVARLENRKRV